MSIQYLFQIWLWFSETVPTSGKLYSMLYCCHILKREIKYCIFLKRRKQEIVPKWGNKGTHLRITRLWQGFQHRDYTTYSSKEPTGVTHTPLPVKSWRRNWGVFIFYFSLSVVHTWGWDRVWWVILQPALCAHGYFSKSANMDLHHSF